MRASFPSLRGSLGLLAGVLAVAVAAQVTVPVPGSAVPQSLQTLGVVLVGGALGARRGTAALVLYLALGAAGLPVFADGAGGMGRLMGPTAGYLGGFVVGAGVSGWWVGLDARRIRGWFRDVGRLAFGFVCVHLVILGMGWARLALRVGPSDAWSEGVAPFLWGGVVKSVVGAVGMTAWLAWSRWEGPGPGPGDGTSGPVEPRSPAV